MSERAQFANDQATFDRYWWLVQRAVRPTRRLPQQVFRKDFDRFVFCDFDRVLGPDFWPLLQQSAFAGPDDSVVAVSLDPDPATGFDQPLGSYGAFRLPVHADSANYTDALWTVIGTEVVGPDAFFTSDVPRIRRGECLMYMAETMLWAAESLQWAVWGERRHELAVLAFRVGAQVMPPAPGQSWTDIDGAKDLVAMSDPHQTVPADWWDEFRSNFGRS